jgi:hypothetical protein
VRGKLFYAGPEPDGFGVQAEQFAAARSTSNQHGALAERFRNEKDPEAANRLGDELGRMVFGG